MFVYCVPVVRSHAAVDHADVAGDLFNLAGGLVLEQDRLVLLLRGQHHSVHSLHAGTQLMLTD